MLLYLGRAFLERCLVMSFCSGLSVVSEEEKEKKKGGGELDDNCVWLLCCIRKKGKDCVWQLCCIREKGKNQVSQPGEPTIFQFLPLARIAVGGAEATAMPPAGGDGSCLRLRDVEVPPLGTPLFSTLRQVAPPLLKDIIIILLVLPPLCYYPSTRVLFKGELWCLWCSCVYT